MTILYKILLYLHIFSAILSIGPFFVILPLIKKLKTAKDDVQQGYLDVFKFTISLSKHAGHVLVVTGILLVMVSGWTWKTSWIVMTVFIMLSSAFFLVRAFSPTVRTFNNPDQDKGESVKILHRSVWIYIALLMAMLWFMVAKPALW